MFSINDANRTVFYLIYGLSVAAFLLALLTGSKIAIVMCCTMLLSSVILLNSGHIFNGLLIRKSGIIEVAGSYRLSNSLNSISRVENGSFRSVSMAFLKPRPNYVPKSEAVKGLFDSISDTFEFSIELAEVDKTKMTENLRTRLRMREIAMSRMDGKSYDKINALKRQIDLISGDIENLSSMGKAFQFLIRLKAISVSDSQAEAELYSFRNIEILANKFSAALGLDYEIIKGEKLLEQSGV